ncbi:MAG: methionyl-tRNA formyltransferase [Acholeplasmataceae bacterium]|nr:methionyl-tRNA formyltransferase [Acholeplasmataceae bacterium]
MKIVFMGTPSFAVPILEMLNKKHTVLLVVTQPDKPTGRKKVMTQSQVKLQGIELNIPIFQPEKLKTDYQKIIDLKPDFLITAAYGQMLPKELLDQIKAINVHGSILPKYRGGAPIQYALFDGLRETGVTVMYMAYLMDSGDIIKQEIVQIYENDNYLTLSQRMSLVGASLLDSVLNDISQGIVHKIPQNPDKVSFAYTLKHEDERISFHQSTESIINRIKGLSPEPGAHAYLKNTMIKFYRAQKGDIIDNKAVPGTVLQSKKRLIIKTLDSSIEILEIQVPGKKAMHTKDFLNGQTIIHDDDVFIERSN